MVVSFKKTAECQCRHFDHTNMVSPEHRRLRFSFQINDFKDPNPSPGPHCLAPVDGGGGFLKNPPDRVNRTFQPFCKPGNLSFQNPQNIASKPERLAPASPAIRLERGNYAEPVTNARRFFPPRTRQNLQNFRPEGLPAPPVSERGGDIRPRFQNSKQSFRQSGSFSQTDNPSNPVSLRIYRTSGFQPPASLPRSGI